MTNFDYISEQIKAGKMNAEQMEEFILKGSREELDCDCSDCRIQFLKLSYVLPIRFINSCRYCHSLAVRLNQNPYTEDFFVNCDVCGARSGYHKGVIFNEQN